MNAIKCLKCNDIIQSKHRHDFVWCSCGAVAVDGGEDYYKRVGNPSDYKELPYAKELGIAQMDTSK